MLGLWSLVPGEHWLISLSTLWGILSVIKESLSFLVVLVVKNPPAPPANAGDERDAGSISRSGRSTAGWHGNPLQYSFAWRIPWTEEPGGLQSVQSQRIRTLSTYSSFLDLCPDLEDETRWCTDFCCWPILSISQDCKQGQAPWGSSDPFSQISLL